jgi:O-acetyl-ADP-ribose deacetylase (regulator of RNase III)
MASVDIKGLYYITHIDNLPSILERGIWSHERVEREGISYTPVYDKGIVSYRKDKCVPDGSSLWGFANLYFNARNPMLYKVIKENPLEDIAVVGVKPTILQKPGIFITTGNAARTLSSILPRDEGIKRLPEIKRRVDIEWWTKEIGSKREIMAECLVPDMVPPEYIEALYVANSEAKKKVRAKVGSAGVHIIPEPHMFFLPSWRKQLRSTNVILVDGDMFFSKMQTLTISVNTVGVMGKGLASRTKYQFPDVYVVYQDVCRSKKLKMGKPYLFKREASLDHELADEPETLSKADAEKWFLLFATKNHWREKADIAGIEEGLRWIQRNYKKEGIESLAVPALGCGLGWLKWRDVGPLLCKHLSTLDIEVAIYLPREKKIPKEHCSRQFLLGGTGR